jgi:transcriptional regulator with XRE-family HTH domain
MNMGDRIKEVRKLRGLTQEELAQKLGLKDSAIAKYESGRVENIKRSVISEMARVLECSPVYLLCLDEDNDSLPANKTSVFDVSNVEKEIIKAYRQADSIDKEMVLRILKIEEKGDAEKLA